MARKIFRAFLSIMLNCSQPRTTKIDPKSIVGSKVTVAISLNDAQGSRWINGIVASFEQCAGDAEFDVYRARIVPSMWQLTLSANCRVFQNKTVLDIAKAVIGEYGLSMSDQTSKSYKQLEYCTQYSESDFHFVSRILEESGIFYWFEHTDQDNKIVLGDGRNAYQDCPLSASIPYAMSEKEPREHTGQGLSNSARRRPWFQASTRRRIITTATLRGLMCRTRTAPVHSGRTPLTSIFIRRGRRLRE